MTTELERLSGWMERNCISEEALRQGLRTSRSIAKILTGERPIYDAFRWYFGRGFGHEALLEVFDIDKCNDDECFQPGRNQRLWRPEVYAAHIAVQAAIKNGQLLPARKFKCHGCDAQATEYHHESYLPEDNLCVVPLDRKCHRRHHTGRKRLTFGVVPTHVGLIRIAIATPQLTSIS